MGVKLAVVMLLVVYHSHFSSIRLEQMPDNPETTNQRFAKAPQILSRRDRPDNSLVKARLYSTGFSKEAKEGSEEKDDG